MAGASQPPILFYIMSKGNMLLGHARGKVGSLVFSRSNGQQVVRSRAEVVKNPQTDAQMVQRILLNTVAQAYSKMSVICDHSFEGVSTGQNSMSYFMRRNLQAIREKLAEAGDFDAAPPFVSPIGTNIFATNDYVIAKGSLPEINPTQVNTAAMILAVGSNSYKSVLNTTGLSRGDQLTFITIQQSPSGVVSFRYRRVILDPRNEDGTEAPLTSEFITNGEVNKPNPRNENVGQPISYSEGGVKCEAVFNINGGAIIASRQRSDGSWLRSNSWLIVSEDGINGAYNMQTALDMFKTGSLDIVNPLFLNNAGVTGKPVDSTSGDNTGGGGDNSGGNDDTPGEND